MIPFSRKIYPFYMQVDLLLAAASFYLPYIFEFNTFSLDFSNIKLPYLDKYSFIFVLWFIFLIIYFKRANLYSTDRNLTIPKEAFMVMRGVFYTSVIIGAVIFFAQYKFFSRKVFTCNFILLCLTLAIWRLIKRIFLRNMIRKGFNNINLVIIGSGRVAEELLAEINKNPFWGVKIVGILDEKVDNKAALASILGKPEDFQRIAKKYFVDEFILTDFMKDEFINNLISQAKKLRFGVRIALHSFSGLYPSLRLNFLGFIPMLTYAERRHNPAEVALKRFIDLLISFILLILLSPLMFLIAIFIKIESKGPIFYVQKRVGFKGGNFNLYKFRSMVNNADKLKSDLLNKNEVKGGIIFKIKKDPRLTPLGSFLRKYSLDELPQLFNVLKGDMSLVGTRPPTPDEVEKYSYNHMHRLSIRPGVTGLSQIRGRSELTFEQWAKLDSWYINNWSIVLDMKILFLTIPAVVSGKGAY